VKPASVGSLCVGSAGVAADRKWAQDVPDPCWLLDVFLKVHINVIFKCKEGLRTPPLTVTDCIDWLNYASVELFRRSELNGFETTQAILRNALLIAVPACGDGHN